MKKWLIKILNKILKKLQPIVFDEVTIKHSYKPLVTVTANYSLNKLDANRVSEERIKEILARQLSEQIIDHMDISHTTSFSPEQVLYRATIQIADNKN